MTLPTKESITEQIGAQIDGGCDELLDEAVVIAGRILERMSVEDHLVLLERMLHGTDAPQLREAHRHVTAALDEVEIWLLSVAI